MSIFSDYITEDPWVGMAYKFWNCTKPEFKDEIWRDAFKLNFSKSKLKEKLKSMLLREDGTMKITQDEFDEMNQILSQHAIYHLDDEYKFIILICLTVPTLNEENLSSILTSCLKRNKLREGDDVKVSIKFPEKEHTFIVIHARTVTPQRIEITLKRK